VPKSVHQGVKPKRIHFRYSASGVMRREPIRVDAKSFREASEAFDAFADNINRKRLLKKKK